jgi:hypothetical protein
MLLRQAVDGVIGALVNLPAIKVDLQRLLALGHQSNPALLNLFASEMPPVAATFALPKAARQRAEAASEPASDAASAPEAASSDAASAASALPAPAPTSGAASHSSSSPQR